jgi:putative membrane protein (TIGR04086 family)
MKNWLKNEKKYLILGGILLIITFILSIIYLLTKISYSIITNLLIISSIIFIGLISYFYSKNKNNKGIIIGLRVGLIIILCLFMLSLIIKHLPSLNQLIYYLLLILASIFGAIIGKNIKN